MIRSVFFRLFRFIHVDTFLLMFSLLLLLMMLLLFDCPLSFVCVCVRRSSRKLCGIGKMPFIRITFTAQQQQQQQPKRSNLRRAFVCRSHRHRLNATWQRAIFTADELERLTDGFLFFRWPHFCVKRDRRCTLRKSENEIDAFATMAGNHWAS